MGLFSQPTDEKTFLVIESTRARCGHEAIVRSIEPYMTIEVTSDYPGTADYPERRTIRREPGSETEWLARSEEDEKTTVLCQMRRLRGLSWFGDCPRAFCRPLCRDPAEVPHD